MVKLPQILPLGSQDLPGALALSASAHWNQNEADWRTMLALGEGWGIRTIGLDGREQLAASTVILPYGATFAWLSMVLVLPEFQRRGYAQQLLRHAIGALSSKGMAGILDATPAGHAVYTQEGFRDTWGFARYRRARRAIEPPTQSRPPGPATRPLRDSDWAAIETLDTPAFGASRLALLRALAQRLPLAARVVEEGGRLRGFVLGRDGREASQIGPLLADDTATATSLIGDALREMPGPVIVDLLDRRQALLPWLQQQDFAFQRPFTRMVHGGPGAPGDTDSIVLVAGPELG
jgi:GNAT superfamily N-acetyltransferase